MADRNASARDDDGPIVDGARRASDDERRRRRARRPRVLAHRIDEIMERHADDRGLRCMDDAGASASAGVVYSARVATSARD